MEQPEPSTPDYRRKTWLLAALAGVGLITLARVVMLILNRTDLFVDEAQYWFWGQELALGHYSKPPLIGWVIRAATDLAGSDIPFWVRLPAPLFHAATALILGAVAARRFGPGPALAVAMAYITLPMVAVGSLLISTDTIMFPFLALALAGYLPLLARDTRWPRLVALGSGAALGLAFMAKYAAVYYLGLAALGAVLSPAMRPRPRDAAFLLGAFALVISPNIVWNLQNGLTTVSHTMDNVGWVADGGRGLSVSPAKLAEFLFSQFAVFGPVLFGGLLWLGATWRRGSVPGLLLLLSLPIVAIVCIQALFAGAYANWAAAAYLAGTLAVVPWLCTKRGWLEASFLINGAICIALPLLTVVGADIQLGNGKLLLSRYLGREVMSLRIFAAAQQTGAQAVVADNRDLLADLFYTGRDIDKPVFAWPEPGRPANHYALEHSYDGGTGGPVLAVTMSDRAPPCAARAQELDPIVADQGAYQGRRISLFLVPPDCWAAP